MNPRITSMRVGRVLEHHLQSYPVNDHRVTHDRYFSTTVAGWILELDRGAGFPWKEITRRGWNRTGATASRRKV